MTALTAGLNQTLALKSDGTAWDWGRNADGQLGDNTTVDKWTPVQVIGLTGVVAVASVGDAGLALKSDATVWGWGDNLYGELGDTTTVERNTPVKTSTTTGSVALAAGNFHSLAITAPAATSSTAVTTSGSPSTYDASVTFTATVTFSGTIPSTEKVTFCDGGTGGLTCSGGVLLGTGAINSSTGVATYSTAALSVATHTVLAYYPADGTYPASSGTVAQIVNAGTLTVVAPAALSMPGLAPGTTSAATNLGAVSFTNTLGDQSGWSVTLGASDLCKTGVVGMPFSKMTITVDQAPAGGSGATGSLTPGAASQPLSGGDTPTCTTVSTGTAALASGTGNSGDTTGTAGTWTMNNNKITVVSLGTAGAGSYTGTLQYTITG